MPRVMAVWLACAAILTGDLRPPLAVAADWPRFRGPNGQGLSDEKDIPVKWSETENVAWKVPVPAEGWSSPVVVGGKVYLTGTTDGGQACHVLAFDAAHRQAALGQGGVPPGADPEGADELVRHPDPGRGRGRRCTRCSARAASRRCPRPARCGGRHAKVSHYSQHGLGASPILYKNLLVMPFDGSSPGPDKKIGWQTPWEEAFILALDTKTGARRSGGRGGASRGSPTPPRSCSPSAGRTYWSATPGTCCRGSTRRPGIGCGRCRARARGWCRRW